MTRDQAKQLFPNALTRENWDALCDQAKRENGGQYPDWWYETIIASGLADRKTQEFQSGELSVVVLERRTFQ